jgi:hypothetical protein
MTIIIDIDMTEVLLGVEVFICFASACVYAAKVR